MNTRLPNSRCITAWATLCARDEVLGEWMQEKVRSTPHAHPHTHPPKNNPIPSNPPTPTLITTGPEQGLPAVQPSAGLGARRKRGGGFA